MGLFRTKWKKVEPQNVAILPPPTLPPLQAQPMPQPEQVKAIQYYTPPISAPTPNEDKEYKIADRLAKKVEELKIKRIVTDMVIEILEGI